MPTSPAAFCFVPPLPSSPAGSEPPATPVTSCSVRTRAIAAALLKSSLPCPPHRRLQIHAVTAPPCASLFFRFWSCQIESVPKLSGERTSLEQQRRGDRRR